VLAGWLSDLRMLTVLFINVPDITPETPLADAQKVMRALQMSLYRFEGSVSRLGIDERGMVLVAALGLPPLAHKDDPVRGVQAAQLAQSQVQQMGYTCAVGVATGRAFCGSIGNERRREYTMVGNVVERAERLMVAVPSRAKSWQTVWPILCDYATYDAAEIKIKASSGEVEVAADI
jgi:hypothetical protein